MQTTATRSIHMIPGKVVGIYLGKTLIEKGIEINLPVPYSGLVLTIEKV